MEVKEQYNTTYACNLLDLQGISFLLGKRVSDAFFIEMLQAANISDGVDGCSESWLIGSPQEMFI